MNPSGNALTVHNLSKRYADVKAVDDVSFEVAHGEIFGLLGPNGAGKTSTIRMILDIIMPDSGRIDVLGGPMSEAKKARIGYLPEERGLYEDMTLLAVLLFLGQLKGLSAALAHERAEKYLRELELWDDRDRKIEALSRGMSQKAQFVAATMHEPELIIVDEPFSGLDPVNTKIIKSLLNGLRERGSAIIMSTHQMNRVEEMCQRIMLIDHGQRVLYGPIDEIRARYAAHAVEVTLDGELPELDGVERIEKVNGVYRLLLQRGVRPEQILKALANSESLRLKRFEESRASLEEIFVQVVGDDATPLEGAA
jgi:ABC-2 type transport system ATP-binding protein